MADYGWQVFSPQGRLIADDSMFNCFYVDHWQSPANFNSRTASYSKSFPHLRYATVEVIVGPSPGSIGSQASETSISTSVTYSNGIPVVNITETVNASISAAFGSTFWIVATRIDASTPVASGYGIQLFDAGNGVTFMEGLPPLVYIGKGAVSLETLQGYSDSFKGYFVIETWNNVPPVCFWRTVSNNVGNIGAVRNETVPYLSGVRRSSVAPQQKNFRWVLMVQFDGGFGTPMTNFNKQVYCFEPFHPSMDGPDTYGLQVGGGTLPINIGTQRPLYIQSLASMASASLSGNNLLSYPPANNLAITNAPYLIKWNGTNNYDSVFWYTGPSYLRGIHTNQAAGGTSYAGYSASWWRSLRASKKYESYVIDFSMYN